jgi:hypothetical protein
MGERTGDWLTAAACSAGPRPAATFADLPRQHQDEVVRLGFTAAAAVAYFVTLGILARPIPSRSLQAHTVLPAAAAPRFELPVWQRVDAVGAARPLPSPGVRPRAASELATAQTPAATAERRAVDAPPPQPRRNMFSRFFRGVWRSVTPAAGKAN